MIKFTDLLDAIEITPKLIYYINNEYRKMSDQVRFSLGKLNPIKAAEVKIMFNILNLKEEHFKDVIAEYPKDVYVMWQPVYNILTLIMVKAYQEGLNEFAYNVNNLIGLIFLGRIRYKFIRVVNQDIFDRTIAAMNKKSYVGLHGTVWMINTICKQVHDRFVPDMLKNPNDVYARYRYIIDMRNRFNQIMRTIAKLYYYTYEHRNDIDPKVALKKRTDDVLDYIVNKSIPVNILEYVVNISNSNIDRISELQHSTQVYASMQSAINIVIHNILERFLAYMTIYKEQFKKNPDLNDQQFILYLLSKLKKSTIVLKSIDNEIFKNYGFSRDEVLAYVTIATIYVDSIKHPSEYYGDAQAPNTVDDYSSNYNDIYDTDSGGQDYSFGENLERLFDGILLDDWMVE